MSKLGFRRRGHANGVSAELKNGVLNLTVPKVPEIQPKKIAVQAS